MEVTSDCAFTGYGPIPPDWRIVPLRDLIRSTEYGSSSKSFQQGQVPVLRMGNLQDGRIDWADLVFTSDEAEIDRYRLRSGDVLFNRTNTLELVGKSSLYDCRFPAIFAGYLIRITVEPPRLDPRFLTYILSTRAARQYGKTVVSLAVGQANINAEKLRSYPIPIPPSLQEQEAIATALQDAEALLEGLKRLIGKKRDLKQAAMQQLLTGRTRLPGFGGEWKTRRLGDYVRYLKHGVNSRAELSTEGPVRYLHYGDVHAAPNAWLDPQRDDLPRLPAKKCERLDRLETGDLVLVDASEDYVGIGKSVELRNVVDMEVVAGLHTIAARFDKSVLADGFKGYLQNMPAFKSHLERLAAGTKVYACNKAHVSSAELRLPSVQEQAAIGTVLSNMDAEIAALEAQRDKTRLLKQSMMQELLTGKTRLV